MARQREEFEFAPETPDVVLGYMASFDRARDGWINFMPGVPEEVADEQPRASLFSAMFGNSPAPVSMCTWMPPSGGRRPRAEATVGIMHPRGRHAVAQLRDGGLPVPPGWTVRQDHPRRGLIVHPPVGTPDQLVLQWALQAGEALTSAPLTGLWKAVLFFPQSAGSGDPRSTTS